MTSNWYLPGAEPQNKKNITHYVTFLNNSYSELNKIDEPFIAPTIHERLDNENYEKSILI